MSGLKMNYDDVERHVLGGSRKITKAEQSVIDAAKDWSVLYEHRKVQSAEESWPEDDALFFAVRVLLATEDNK